MIEFFSYGFIQKAFLGGMAIAISCGIIGPFLVLRKQSLLGDGLAHLAFGGIALGMFLGVDPLWAALVTSVLGSWAVQKMVKKKLYGDAAIAVLLSLGVGTGVVMASLAGGLNAGLYHYLIGSILALSLQDLYLIYSVLGMNIVFLYYFYPAWFSQTFNEELAEFSIPTLSRTEFFFTIMTALTVVISIRAVGILLVGSLLVIPSLIALGVARSFRETLFLSCSIGTLSVIVGILIAYGGDIPPGGSIILTLFLFFLVSSGIKKLFIH